jgi:type 1 glutamine amidotransferase
MKPFTIAWTTLVALAALAAFHTIEVARSEETVRPIRVLIVDGFSNHDWKLTTRLIRGIIEPTGLFSVAVSTAPATAAAPGWDQWRPKFSDFDVVIQNCNDIHGGPSWPKPVQDDFEAFVRNGGGLLAFHSANNAFPKWPEYTRMLGIAWRGKGDGTALSIDEKQRIVRIPPGEGSGTSHGARSNVLVHTLGEHPIHDGLPTTWMTPSLEVYTYARGPAENIQVLSYGYDPKTKMNWPLEWTVSYGKGRVYSSTFGHVWKGDVQPASMRCADEQTLLLRALQWLANRPITVVVPKDFPSASAVSIRPEINLPKD